MSSPDGNTAVRERLVLALDVPGLDEAVELADRMRPWFGVVKVGLELFSAEGPLAVDTLLDAGFRVFLDLKLHDIPTTVRRAAHRIGSLGVSYATVHAAGGGQMLKAAVEGFEEGWATAVANGQPDPQAGSAGILAVTVLTSEPDADSALVARRGIARGARGLPRCRLRGVRPGGRRRAGARARHGRTRDPPKGCLPR